MPGKWWIICGYSRDLYLLSHTATQRYTNIPNVSQSFVVSVFVWPHICMYFCIYTRAYSICSYMFLCDWLHFVSWWRAGSREAETQEAPNKIGSDSLPQCWWKIWLFPSSGVGVWYFKLPSLWQYARQNKVYKNRQMLSEEKRHGNWAGAWLHLSSPHSPYLSPSHDPLWQDVSIVQMQKQPSCLLI